MTATPYREKWVSDCGTVTLYCGDCLEVLPTLEAGSVDAVVTDPPYGIGFARYESHEDDAEAYGQFMLQAVGHSERLTTGPKVFWQGMLNCARWHQWFPASFRLFAACKGFVQFRPTPVQWSWDPVIWWGQVAGEASVHKKDFHIQTLAPFGIGRKKIEHPCPRPLQQVEYVVDLFTQLGDIVLDVTMGSGTTGVACVRLGRRFIGIELEPKYFAIAKRRIIDELNRVKFLEPPKRERQKQLIETE